MSYDLIETSDALGEPIELYRFSYGSGAANVFAYTDGDFEVQHLTDRYTPTAIEREAIVSAQTLDKATIEVTMPQDTEIAELFLGPPPAATVGLTIFRTHIDPDTGDILDPQTIWAGRVLGASREDYMASLNCEPVLTSLRRVGLRRHYQYMCPHVLYGARCRANAADFMTVAEVASADPRTVTVSGELDEAYVGGVVAWQPVGQPVERRTILQREYDSASQSTRFVVAGGIRDLAAGDEIELYFGCRHTLADCRDRFNNAPNYGGMPFIPGQNPHGTSSIYH